METRPETMPGPERLGVNEAFWREMLINGHTAPTVLRWLMKRLPSAPRCRACFSPFGGVGGWLVGLIGFRPSRKNPHFCVVCCEKMPPGGAEVDIAVLFADVRGSTALGERLGPRAFAGLMQRFYAVATETLVAHDAIVDKLVGDEVVALFIPGIAGPNYRRRAAHAAIDLLQAVGYTRPGGPWLNLGLGLHAGPAFVGNFGAEGMLDFTALGDTVNVGARLQAEAATGEILLSAPVYETIVDLCPDLPASELLIRGRETALPIYRLARPGAPGRALPR